MDSLLSDIIQLKCWVYLHWPVIQNLVLNFRNNARLKYIVAPSRFWLRGRSHKTSRQLHAQAACFVGTCPNFLLNSVIELEKYVLSSYCMRKNIIYTMLVYLCGALDMRDGEMESLHFSVKLNSVMPYKP